MDANIMYASYTDRRCYTRAFEKARYAKRPQEGLLIGPVLLDNVPQISRLLLIVQGEDLRDTISYSRLFLVRVEFRTAGEVESGVTRLG